MADYIGTTLCKEPFAVRNPDKFEKLLKDCGIHKERDSGEGELWYDRQGNKFEIYGYGSLSSVYNADNNIEIGTIIQPFLLPGEVAALMEVGNTKCRYDESGGYAIVITNKEIKWFSLHDWVDETAKELRNKAFHLKIEKDGKAKRNKISEQV